MRMGPILSEVGSDVPSHDSSQGGRKLDSIAPIQRRGVQRATS
jgi:hypothetical protein